MIDHSDWKLLPIAGLLERLGKRIALYRLSRGLRQEDVAEAAGVARGTVARLEAGEGGTIETLVRVMRALELEGRLDSLFPDAEADPFSGPDLRSRKRARPSAKPSDASWRWGDE